MRAFVTLVCLCLYGCSVSFTGYKLEDFDGDGYSIDEGDCEDLTYSINPGADEVCADSVDNDCDGKVDFQDSDCVVDTGIDTGA